MVASVWHSDKIKNINIHRFIKMTVRRHIQEEESPRMQEETDYTGIENGSPIIKSHTAINIRDRKIKKSSKVLAKYLF